MAYLDLRINKKSPYLFGTQEPYDDVGSVNEDRCDICYNKNKRGRCCITMILPRRLVTMLQLYVSGGLMVIRWRKNRHRMISANLNRTNTVSEIRYSQGLCNLKTNKRTGSN